VRRYTVVVDGSPFTIDVAETAADRFEVTVDGRTFEASLESDQDLPGAVISPELPLPDGPRASAGASSVATARTPTPGPALPPRTHAGTPGAAGGSRAEVISAPMPGVVLEVVVVAGAVLKRGDPVLVLEAMKMRNTIRAPHAAVVTSVEVEAGQPVGPGDPLVRLGPAPG
jgi:glutaconyl-CoA/methylmalonyl-CoA decarboxylase subunit gamma